MTRAEWLARCLAARKMGLIKDKRGVCLPAELWEQCLPEAEFVLGALVEWEVHEVIRRYHEAEDDG